MTNGATILNAMQAFDPRRVKIERLSGPNLLGDDRLVRAAQDLANKASEPNPFFEPWYLFSSIKAFDADQKVSVLAFWHLGSAAEHGGGRHDAELIGLVPMQAEWRYDRYPLPHWRSWVHENCFSGQPLVLAGAEETFWRALLNWCDSHAGPRLFLHLSQMPLETTLVAAIRNAAKDRLLRLVHQEERALLHSEIGPDEYLQAALPNKKRKELRRQHRRLSEQGDLTFERQLDDTGLNEWIAEFLKLEASGWKGEAGSALASAKSTQSLFEQALPMASQSQRLERLTLRLDEKPIAMLVNFLTPPGAFSFKTAYDEQLARFSPGVLLQRENLAMLDNEQIQWCDSCAAPDHPMIDKLWRERRKIGRISVGIGGHLHQAAFRQLARQEQGHDL